MHNKATNTHSYFDVPKWRFGKLKCLGWSGFSEIAGYFDVTCCFPIYLYQFSQKTRLVQEGKPSVSIGVQPENTIQRTRQKYKTETTGRKQ